MLILAMFSTVVLLVWMGFFMLGSLPLLVLKHDTPLDSRFIRGLFNVYYVAVMVTATVGAASFALADRFVFASAFAVIGLIGLASRRLFLTRMDVLRGAVPAMDPPAIRQFRMLHIGGMVANVAQLLALCISMTKVSL